MSLIHYVIVRNDLPLGVLTAMVAHAAGESAFLFNGDSIFKNAIAVVLAVDNELALHKAAQHLRNLHVLHTEVVEGDGPYKDQLMAIGVVPGKRDTLDKSFKEFKLLKTCLDKVHTPGVIFFNPNETEHIVQGQDNLSPLARKVLMGLHSDEAPNPRT